MSRRFDPADSPSSPMTEEEHRLGPSPGGARASRGIVLGVLIGGGLWIVALLLYFS